MSKDLPDELKETYSNSKEIKQSFSEQMAQQKQKADLELKKIEKAIIAVFDNLKTDAGNNLQEYKNSFEKLLKEFAHRIHTQDEMTLDDKNLQEKKDNLNARIFGNYDSVDAAEKRLREVLKELNTRKESQEDTNKKTIELIKKIIDMTLANPVQIEEKKDYEERINILQDYFEALVEGADENESKNNTVSKQQKVF